MCVKEKRVTARINTTNEIERSGVFHSLQLCGAKRGSDGAEPLSEAPVGLISRALSSHFQHPKEPAVTSRHKIPSPHARTVRVRGDSMRPCTT